MSAIYDVIVTILIYGQFGAIGKPDSGRMACKFFIFINSNLRSCVLQLKAELQIL